MHRSRRSRRRPSAGNRDAHCTTFGYWSVDELKTFIDREFAPRENPTARTAEMRTEH
jgi:hypothetical protein